MFLCLTPKYKTHKLPNINIADKRRGVGDPENDCKDYHLRRNCDCYICGKSCVKKITTEEGDNVDHHVVVTDF